MNRRKRSRHFGFLLLFALVVFLAVLVNSGIAVLSVYILVDSGLIVINGTAPEELRQLVRVYVLLSIPFGLMIALLASKVPLKPVRNLIDSMDRLASGDFSTRVNVGSIMRRYPSFVEVSRSFNQMAEQLEHTELLRSDFVNNFSHEFKTPIVSIAGFAKLLRRGKLTEDQRQEYLAIIEEESLRLSYMATNVLNLTKVENQTILTDVTAFNLSEQIRSCILLMEDKWMKKELEFCLRLEEHTIWANEELLKQVWINLIDNAVKFSPAGGRIDITLRVLPEEYSVSVKNFGSEIPLDKQDKIFNKFYQADESHASEGNGVGLAIVKRITELHRGSVRVESAENTTEFTVRLPISGKTG